jgi:hypothetical protein
MGCEDGSSLCQQFWGRNVDGEAPISMAAFK